MHFLLVGYLQHQLKEVRVFAQLVKLGQGDRMDIVQIGHSQIYRKDEVVERIAPEDGIVFQYHVG